MFIVRASSESDCNDEECAPDKEVSSFNSQNHFLVNCVLLFYLFYFVCLFGSWENYGKLGIVYIITLFKAKHIVAIMLCL